MYKIERLKLCQIDELAGFMADSDFLWNDIELLIYIIEVLSRKVDDNVVVTHTGKIVGCNLFLHTLASINGEIRDVRWSHSTYLAPEHRRHIGLEFFGNSYSGENTWGFGLTDINRKIHILNGSTFCAESRAYVLYPSFTPSEWKGCCENCGRSPFSKYNIPASIELDGRTFLKCFSKEDHRMPDDGFWNPGILNVDFVRNREFMEKRFYNFSNDYQVYKCMLDTNRDELYFVFKIKNINGVESIFLVDYRFDLTDTKGLARILDCICYIAFINSIGCIYLFTTLPIGYVMANYASIAPYGLKALVVTNSTGVSENTFLMATPADSDCELAPY